jgi:putative SbcD/Mre11-related phosphoesterase
LVYRPSLHYFLPQYRFFPRYQSFWMVMITPLYDERVLSLDTPQGRLLILADLHIGIEYELALAGVNIPPQSPHLFSSIDRICRIWKPDRIILLGDVKHIIPKEMGTPSDYAIAVSKERKEIHSFLRQLNDHAKLEIIPGNHDGSIRRIISSRYTIHPSHGLLLTGTNETVGLVHGHAWPSQEVMTADYVIMGHTHPTLRLRAQQGYIIYKPCWIRASFLREKIKKRYGKVNPTLIVVPSFNPLCGGIAVNVDGIANPLSKIVDIDNSRVYLLNGTNLGKVKDLRD